MNRKSIRALMLGAMIIAMFATMASTAGATNWLHHGTTITAATGAGTLTVGASSLICDTGNATGDVANTSPSFPGTWTNAVTGTVIFDGAGTTGCRVAGAGGYSVHCRYALSATGHTGADVH